MNQEASIGSFIKRSSFFKPEALAVVLGLVFAQALSFFFHIHQQENARITIESMLKKNEFSGNAYRAAQALESLESMGVITCSTITDVETGALIFDQALTSQCKTGLFGSFDQLEFNLNSGSGQKWKIETTVKTNSATQILLICLHFFILVVSLLIARIVRWRLTILRLEKEAETVQKEAVAELSRQVTHDIRSPLSALNIISGTLSEVSEEKRALIQQSISRISEIANDLLKKDVTSSLVRGQEPVDNIQFCEFVKGLLREKQIEWEKKVGLTFSFESKTDEDPMISFNKKELARIFSNLINNSGEAIAHDHGKITVTVASASHFAYLIIHDNGGGISKEKIALLGRRGVSFDKPQGFGIGLYHAIKTLQNHNGELKISSVLGQGTSVQLTFKKIQHVDLIRNSMAPKMQKRI